MHLRRFKETAPQVIKSFKENTPTVLPVLKHKHRSVLGHAVLLAGGAALGCMSVIAFAVLHNQYTARVSKEYFSEGFHKVNMRKVSDGVRLHDWLGKKDSSTLWGGAWGVIAGGEIGVFAGPILSALALLGPWAPMPGKHMSWAALIAVLSASGASIAGCSAAPYIDARFYNGRISRLSGQQLELNSAHKRVKRYARSAVAHNALYGVEVPAILSVALYTLVTRICLQRKYNRIDKKRARKILMKVSRTDDNRQAVSVLLEALV